MFNTGHNAYILEAKGQTRLTCMFGFIIHIFYHTTVRSHNVQSAALSLTCKVVVFLVHIIMFLLRD